MALLASYVFHGAAAVTNEETALPSYMRYVEPGDSIVLLDDSTFCATSARTIFIVNKWGLNPRDTLIRRLRDEVLPMVYQRGYKLAALQMRGAASPEGPYEGNVLLSRKRAETLSRFITDSLHQVPLPPFSVSTMPEDYDYLVLLMHREADPEVDLVQRIVESAHGDPFIAKERLQEANGGKLWKRLLKEYFPELRAARVVMFLTTARPVLATAEPLMLPERPLQPPTIDTSIDWCVPWELRRPHMLAVSTNILYDGFWMPHFGWAPMPNVGLEWYPRNSPWTLRAAFMWPYYHKWSKNKFFQIRDYHIEVRRYFNPGQSHTGWYAGAYVNATKYGIGLSKTKGWQGEGIGAAVKAGYVIGLGRHNRWRLDLHAAFGGWITRYDPYVYGNPITGTEDGDYYYDYTGPVAEFHKRNHRFSWFGPTELGITITYDLLFYRHGGGASMRSVEKGVCL